jgi:hypothetical protein
VVGRLQQSDGDGAMSDKPIPTVKIRHVTAPSPVRCGIRITVELPPYESGGYQHRASRDEFLRLAAPYTWFNPHLSLEVTWNGEIAIHVKAPDPTSPRGPNRPAASASGSCASGSLTPASRPCGRLSPSPRSTRSAVVQPARSTCRVPSAGRSSGARSALDVFVGEDLFWEGAS